MALLKRIHSSFVVTLQTGDCGRLIRDLYTQHKIQSQALYSSHLLIYGGPGRVERTGRQTIASFPGPSPTVSIGEPARAAAQLCY